MFQTAVQLYSFRDQCAKDFVDMLKLVAIIGFKGVEPAGFYNLSPKEFRKIVNDLGMEVCSAHGPWLRSVEMIPEAIDTLGELGLKTAVCGYGLCPKVKFELDCYWSANFGKVNPVEVMKRFRDRTILVHMKDGVLDPDIPMLPLGSGKLPIPEILAAVDPKLVKWVIVELDNCVIDMYRAMKKSYQYLTTSGLTIGNR